MGTHTFVAVATALVLLASAAGCSDGDLGSATVRWRIVDLLTGVQFDPKAQGQPDGSCVGPGAIDEVTGNTVPAWVVNHVRLTLTDPVSGAPVPVDPGVVVFDCRQREATTAFQLPLGSFAFNLCPFSTDPTVCDEGVTPPPAVRTVVAAQIINLDVIEIGVQPPAPLAPSVLGFYPF
jgi:hypothetical protein